MHLAELGFLLLILVGVGVQWRYTVLHISFLGSFCFGLLARVIIKTSTLTAFHANEAKKFIP